MDRLNVTHLIRKFNILLNLKHNQKLSSSCICLFRLCNENIHNTNNKCAVHDEDDGCGSNNNNSNINNNDQVFFNSIINQFINKNILFLNTLYYGKIVYNKYIHMILPLIIHIHFAIDKTCHFWEKSSPVKLNNPLVNYTNLLIINFIKCEQKKCNNYNKFLSDSKTILFKYAIFINHNNINIQNYIERDYTNNVFKYKIGIQLSNEKDFVNKCERDLLNF